MGDLQFPKSRGREMMVGTQACRKFAGFSVMVVVVVASVVTLDGDGDGNGMEWVKEIRIVWTVD